MTQLSKYGYIILGEGYLPAQHSININSSQFSSTVKCVSTIQEAITEAKNLVSEGVQVIELCGGFGQSGAFKIVNAIDCKVPVGYVSFSGYEHDKLTDFLSDVEESEY